MNAQCLAYILTLTSCLFFHRIDPGWAVSLVCVCLSVFRVAYRCDYNLRHHHHHSQKRSENQRNAKIKFTVKKERRNEPNRKNEWMNGSNQRTNERRKKKQRRANDVSNAQSAVNEIKMWVRDWNCSILHVHTTNKKKKKKKPGEITWCRHETLFVRGHLTKMDMKIQCCASFCGGHAHQQVLCAYHLPTQRVSDIARKMIIEWVRHGVVWRGDDNMEFSAIELHTQFFVVFAVVRFSLYLCSLVIKFSAAVARTVQFSPNELVLNGKSPSDSSFTHKHTPFGWFDMVTSPTVMTEDAGCECHCRWCTHRQFLIDKWWSGRWKCVPSSPLHNELAQHLMFQFSDEKQKWN